MALPPSPAETAEDPHETAVAALLRQIRDGDGKARVELCGIFYAELHRMARRQMGRQRRDHTLRATELVNEAFLRLVDNGRAGWQDRNHFVAAAAGAMRSILVDHARRRRNARRSGEGEDPVLDLAVDSLEGPDWDLEALDGALQRLAERDWTLARAWLRRELCDD